MLTTKLRPFVKTISRISPADAASKNVARALASTQNFDRSGSNSSSRRFITTEQERSFREEGILDEMGMTAFSTLHELQANSSRVYAENELFGTYQEDSNKFHFMTYDDYNQKVNQCRALLKDLGE